MHGFESEAAVVATVEVIRRQERGRQDEGKSHSHPLGDTNARPVETHLRTYFLLTQEWDGAAVG